MGDVVGYPALASASMEQRRRAVCHAVGKEFEPCPVMLYGLVTIPEISMVGPSEEQLATDRVPYEVGLARIGGGATFAGAGRVVSWRHDQSTNCCHVR